MLEKLFQNDGTNYQGGSAWDTNMMKQTKQTMPEFDAKNPNKGWRASRRGPPGQLLVRETQAEGNLRRKSKQ